MLKQINILILLIIITVSTDAVSKGKYDKSVVVLSAKGYKSKLISLNREEHSGAIANPYKFKLFFKNATLEHGNINNIPKNFSLIADVSDDYIFLNEDRISLVVDVTNPDEYKLLDYSKISSFSCFDKNKIDSANSDFYFSKKYESIVDVKEIESVNKQLCIKIRN